MTPHAVVVGGEPGGHEHGVESGHRPVEAGQGPAERGREPFAGVHAGVGEQHVGEQPFVVAGLAAVKRGGGAYTPRPRRPASQDNTHDRPPTTALRIALNALTAAHMTANRTNKRGTAMLDAARPGGLACYRVVGARLSRPTCSP